MTTAHRLGDPSSHEGDELVPPYVEHLRARGIAAVYVPQFEAEARAFVAWFRAIGARSTGGRAIARYIDEGRRQAFSERALRNRRIACQSFLAFVAEHAASRSAVVKVDKRRGRRAERTTEVLVEGHGLLRSSDIGVGGMYVDRLTMVSQGSTVRVRFKLNASDEQTITVSARVCFVHPQLGAGLEFVSLSPAAGERIRELVERA